ncbi:DUF4430 domain-containing protein [Latilactobacillus fuchuensis]|uniref:Metal ion ABC transporter, substrate-binding lipoprotein n=1 Tax=Latilactobacillus fuchuensis TaxID=164393 RepID=A0A2N9DY37_9LACO|nr:DUF4430 domain-containing protein [Latilactobacillus fuchuensis]SPC39797.1 putative metal ion ABC transporter, substrate-binding lipoprotein [Latilactobacillus fuchuensis]
MSKKRIIEIIASLLVVLGISYGAYASVNKSQSSATSSSQVSKKKSGSKDAQPQEIGLKGKAKAKKSAKTTKASKKAESAKAESEKKVAASQASSSQKVAVEKAAQASSTKQVADQQAAASTSQAAVAAKQVAASQAAKQPAANTNQQAQTTTTAQPATKKVTVSIYGPISEGDKLLINHDSVAMNDGDKVIDVLKRDTAGHGMALSYKGAASTVYVQGINGLFEFDKGSQSGWLYRVNGVFPNYSCGSYTVKSGDVIEWMYTEDLGHDRNAPQG